MTEARLLRLIALLPEGVQRDLFPSAARRRRRRLRRTMPDYRQADELAALLSPAVRAAASGRRRHG